MMGLFKDYSLFIKFYESEQDLFEGYNKPIPKALYRVRDLLEAEEGEVNSPDDAGIPAPSWMFYYWVGDCFVALDPYHSHPFQPKDESYSSDIKKAAKCLSKTPKTLGAIKDYVKKRGSKNADKIIAAIDNLHKLLTEKLTKLAQQ
jgi:hypothetical protein